MSKCMFSGADVETFTLNNRDGISVRSPNGEYWISRQAQLSYQGPDGLSEKEKLLCLQEAAKLNRQGLIPFWLMQIPEDPNIQGYPNVVPRSIEAIKNQKIDHRNKDLKILNLLAEKIGDSVNPFSYTKLTASDLYFMGIFSDDELYTWIFKLREKGLISFTEEMDALMHTPGTRELIRYIKVDNIIGLTVEGWDLVHSTNRGKLSRNVFIAMAFTDIDGNPIPSQTRDSIRSVLEKNDWKPIVVDEVEHNDGIMDKVMASINESRFVIAELTHHKSGVYYEAGYAKGKGLPVIHVVHESDLKNCHFDVKHLNLIVWKNVEDLTTKLENRIKATMGV